MSTESLLIAFLFAPLTLFAEKEVAVQSAISEVTVYQQSANITIKIEDQLPLTSNEDIEIERESLSGGKVDEVTGEITWLLDISKGKTKDVDFKYSIRYPKNMLLAWK